MEQPNRNYTDGTYRYGFQGQEKDDELKGKGNSVNYKYRMHDSRLGRFFALDPLAAHYPHNSPYAFAENKVIAFVELEGLEIALPRIGPVYLPRPVISIPRAPAIPAPPSIPLPPIVAPNIETIPAYPTSPSLPFDPSIQWEKDIPLSPEDLGAGWEETTHPDNKSGSRDFENKDTGEKVRWDPGKEGKPGWEGKDHWHRYNPNSTSKRDLYLDRLGNPVARGSHASHLGAGESFVLAIPGMIKTAEGDINKLNQRRKKLSIWNTKDWNEIHTIRQAINKIEGYIDDLRDYKDNYEDYNKKMDEYYKNCDNCKS